MEALIPHTERPLLYGRQQIWLVGLILLHSWETGREGDKAHPHTRSWTSGVAGISERHNCLAHLKGNLGCLECPYDSTQHKTARRKSSGETISTILQLHRIAVPVKVGRVSTFSLVTGFVKHTNSES